MQMMRDARQTNSRGRRGGRSASFASASFEATTARAAKAARHLPDFEAIPLRELLMNDCGDDDDI